MSLWEKLTSWGRRDDPKSLTEELVRIGKQPHIRGGEGSEPYFWRPPGKGIGPTKSWDARTRAIGEELHARGKGSLALMLLAHEAVVEALGPLAGHALSAHWHEVGLEAWQAGRGECWLH
jgi:hypothetical protein